MSEQAPLDIEKLRTAFKELRDRQQHLEALVAELSERFRLQTIEYEARMDYIRGCQAKIDKYSLELDHALPGIHHAAAQLGRALDTHDRLWTVIVNTSADVHKLRDLVDNPGDSDKGGDLDTPVG